MGLYTSNVSMYVPWILIECFAYAWSVKNTLLHFYMQITVIIQCVYKSYSLFTLRIPPHYLSMCQNLTMQLLHLKATIHGATLLLATVVTRLWQPCSRVVTPWLQPGYNCCKQQSCPVYGGLNTTCVLHNCEYHYNHE